MPVEPLVPAATRVAVLVNPSGQDDAGELRDNAGRLDQMKWPWPVVSLLLGSTDADTVRAAAATAAAEPTRRGQACEADFYLGVHAVSRDNLVRTAAAIGV